MCMMLDSKYVLKYLDNVLQKYFNIEWDEVINQPFAKTGKGKNKLRSCHIC